jgi:GntR family transcriptional repressor for pyruvate dehydrogenase complex
MSTEFLRISTAEAVVNYIKSRIESGALKAGDSLPGERTLQSDLKISRFALREGLARLNALGIVSSSQGKASVVNADVNATSLNNVFLPLGSGDCKKYVQDLFFSRDLIETECASLAATNRTDEQLERMVGLAGSLEKSIDDPEAFSELNYQLHHMIIEASGNVFLYKIHELLHNQIKPALDKSITDPEHCGDAVKWHHKVLEAIKAKDAENARSYMVGHLNSCKNAYTD